MQDYETQLGQSTLFEIADLSTNSPQLTTTPFELSKLRLSQNYATAAGTIIKHTTTIPVRKPTSQTFNSVHPSDNYKLETMVMEVKEDRETYLVDPALWQALARELTPKALFLAIDRQKNPFIWPIRLPGEDGRIDNWNASSLEAAEMARKNWIRVAANMSLGAYDIYQATGDLPGPEWPDMDFTKILEIAFKGRYITTLDHPALRRLRGEV